MIREGPMLKATSGLMYEGVELTGTSDSKTVKSCQDHLLAKLISSLKDFSAGFLSATKLSCFHNLFRASKCSRFVQDHASKNLLNVGYIKK